MIAQILLLAAVPVFAQVGDLRQTAPLALCAKPWQNRYSSGRVDQMRYESGVFRMLDSHETSDEDCDATFLLEKRVPDPSDAWFRWQVITPATKAVIASGEAENFWGLGGMIRKIIEPLEQELQPGERLHSAALAQREKAARDASRASAAPAGGVSKEELKELVKAAVEGAGQGKAPAAEKAAAEPSSDVDAPKYKKAAPRASDLAVVVGVEKYVDLPEARFAERDAKAVRDHLIALGYPERNVVLLTGERASRAGLVKTVDTWLGQNAKEDSTIFFYFSGHGAPDTATGEAYLVPRDGDPAFLEDTGYPLKRLYAKLAGTKAKRAVVALDACFSGAGGRSVLPKGARPLVAKVDTTAPPARVVALTASAASEISGTDEEQGHGLFTYFLLRGLNGAAKDDAGAVTLASLHEYLTPNVQDEARRQNRQQTPQLVTADKAAAKLRLR